MTEALGLALAWARDTHSVRRFTLTTHPTNSVSQRVAEKAGFRRRHVVPQNPPFRDGETTAILFELGLD